jgi:simple sugar transport system permease protein
MPRASLLAQERERSAPLRLLLILATALALAFLIVLCASKEPWVASRALLLDVLPRLRWSADEGWRVYRLTRFGAVLQDWTTLTLLGLAVAIPFRARQFSLGADGQFFLGALASAAASLYLPPSLFLMPLACLAAILAGSLWGGAAGVLKARWGANEVVTTLMLNVVALELFRLTVTTVMRDPGAGFVTTPVFPDEALLASMLPRTNVNLMVLGALLAAFAGWFLVERTTLGMDLRLVGDAPAFAHHAGVAVPRTMAVSIALGGAFAGLAGFHVANGLLKRLPVDLNPGLGLEGVVVALLARNDAKWIPLAAFLYAYLRVGAQVMERTSDVPREMVVIIQALIVLLAVSDRLPATLTAWAMRRRAARPREAA